MPAQTLEPYLQKWNLPECSSHKLAYFAGLFDGEGCIQLHRNTSTSKRTKSKEAGTGLSINVVNTDIRPLKEVQTFFGGTIHTKCPNPERKITHKVSFYWMLHGKKAAYFLSLIVEHLIIKKEQAEAAVCFAETYFSDWRHCEKQGWPLTAEAAQLRRLSFRAFRASIASTRTIAWHL